MCVITTKFFSLHLTTSYHHFVEISSYVSDKPYKFSLTRDVTIIELVGCRMCVDLSWRR